MSRAIFQSNRFDTGRRLLAALYHEVHEGTNIAMNP